MFYSEKSTCQKSRKALNLNIPRGYPNSPEKNLINYMVFDAIRAAKKKAGIEKREAIHWLMQSKSQEPWSFRWCCDVLGLDYHTLRRKLCQNWSRINVISMHVRINRPVIISELVEINEN